jgi:hypothetical protein
MNWNEGWNKTEDALKNYILNSHEEEKLVSKERLKNNCSKISLSTDIWTSPSQIPFMTITCHISMQNFNYTANDPYYWKPYR